jgi:hypothetical protein
LLDKANQLVTDHVRKAARAGRTEGEDLEAMRKQIAVAMRAAELDIVVNRVIVSRDHLKSGEVRVRYRAARVAKNLAHHEVVERSPLRHAKLFWIEVCQAAALLFNPWCRHFTLRQTLCNPGHHGSGVFWAPDWSTSVVCSPASQRSWE